MNIKVRMYGDYADVTVCTDYATLELGWQSKDERRQLAEHLREVADDLFPLEDTE
jgi:hypothetical protein